MYPADFYALTLQDRRRAIRYLHCHDGPGLQRLAAACAEHLRAQYGVPVPLEHVLITWQRAGLICERHAQLALAPRARALGS